MDFLQGCTQVNDNYFTFLELVIPGAGVTVKAVQVAAGKEPILVGKPSRIMFEYIHERYGVVPETTIMFGDRCETDIKFAHINGLKSVLVGTGIHHSNDVELFEKQGNIDLIPTYYTSSLKSLCDMLHHKSE